MTKDVILWKENSPPTPGQFLCGVVATGFRGDVHPHFEKKLNQFVKRKKLYSPLFLSLSVSSYTKKKGWEGKREREKEESWERREPAHGTSCLPVCRPKALLKRIFSLFFSFLKLASWKFHNTHSKSLMCVYMCLAIKIPHVYTTIMIHSLIGTMRIWREIIKRQWRYSLSDYLC